MNVKKTKEMLTDFRKAPTVVPHFFINGAKVERVTEYKYLGTVLDSKLIFNKNTDFIHKRCQPIIFCLQMLRIDLLMSVLLFYALSTGVVLNQF